MFGAFFQNLPRAERRHLRIDGEPIAVVDYRQLFLRLACAEAGRSPPPGDLYDLTGCDHLRPDWTQLRAARKKLVNALFFRQAALKQWPGEAPSERDAIRRAFSGLTPRQAIAPILDHHRAIADWFERGRGLRLMKTESDLCVAVMLRLLKQGITALPIHDAVLVAERHATAAKTLMEQEAKRLTGAHIPAEIKTATDAEVG